VKVLKPACYLLPWPIRVYRYRLLGLLAAVFARKLARRAPSDVRIALDDLKAVGVGLELPRHRETDWIRFRPRGRFPGLVHGHPADKRARNDPNVLGEARQRVLTVPRLDAVSEFTEPPPVPLHLGHDLLALAYRGVVVDGVYHLGAEAL